MWVYTPVILPLKVMKFMTFYFTVTSTTTAASTTTTSNYYHSNQWQHQGGAWGGLSPPQIYSGSSLSLQLILFVALSFWCSGHLSSHCSQEAPLKPPLWRKFWSCHWATIIIIAAAATTTVNTNTTSIPQLNSRLRYSSSWDLQWGYYRIQWW